MRLLIEIFAVVLAWTFVQGDDQNIKQAFFLHKSSEGENEALLAVLFTQNEEGISARCELFIDNDQITEVLESSSESPVRPVSEQQMEGLLDECSEVVLVRGSHETSSDDSTADPSEYARRAYRERRRSGEGNTEVPAAANTGPSDAETTTAGYDGIPVIFPGTKWCGAGDRAKSYDDLGLHQDTDRCCRAHDLCNDTLAPGETRNKLTNKSPFTKLSCQCDNDFYKCLDRVNSVTSNTIGNMYFNVLKRECYAEDYPIKYPKKCIKYKTFLKITCKEYEKNTKGAKEYQWVKAKKYKKIPIPGPITVTLPF